MPSLNSDNFNFLYNCGILNSCLRRCMLFWTAVSHSAGELCCVSATDDTWKTCNMMKAIFDCTKLVCLLANVDHSSLCVCVLAWSKRIRYSGNILGHTLKAACCQDGKGARRLEQHVSRANWCSILWFKRWLPDTSSPSLCGKAGSSCALTLLCLQIQKLQMRIGSGL